ncbi:MAG TPA: zinc-dependent alcohol dehydrogenase family protein [Candidatus Binatia bacterium]
MNRRDGEREVKMLAMQLETNADLSARPLRLVEIASPQPRAGEILVRVSACGVCRTDLHVIEAELAPQKLPLVPGHQVVGTVETIGEGCSRFHVGDRVGIAWLRHTCGACEFCRSGRENLCAASRYTGYHDDGGYAELAVVPETFAYAIPDAIGDVEAAPLLCAGIIGYRALTLASVPSGGSLLLCGFGSSAHIVLQIARRRGQRVLVATRGAGHRELARSLGAEWVGEAVEAPPHHVDSAIVFAPSGDIVPAALKALKKGGTCALAGIYMTPIPPLPYEECVFHEKILRSVEANTRADGEGLFREAAAAGIHASTVTFPLEQANEALQMLKGDGIRGSAVLLPPK